MRLPEEIRILAEKIAQLDPNARKDVDELVDDLRRMRREHRNVGELGKWASAYPGQVEVLPDAIEEFLNDQHFSLFAQAFVARVIRNVANELREFEKIDGVEVPQALQDLFDDLGDSYRRAAKQDIAAIQRMERAASVRSWIESGYSHSQVTRGLDLFWTFSRKRFPALYELDQRGRRWFLSALFLPLRTELAEVPASPDSSVGTGVVLPSNASRARPSTSAGSYPRALVVTPLVLFFIVGAYVIYSRSQTEQGSNSGADISQSAAQTARKLPDVPSSRKLPPGRSGTGSTSSPHFSWTAAARSIDLGSGPVSDVTWDDSAGQAIAYLCEATTVMCVGGRAIAMDLVSRHAAPLLDNSHSTKLRDDPTRRTSFWGRLIGSHLVYVRRTNNIALWDVSSQRQIASLAWRTCGDQVLSGVTATSAHPGIVVARTDCTTSPKLRVWEVAHERETVAPVIRGMKPSGAIAVSEDGALIGFEGCRWRGNGCSGVESELMVVARDRWTPISATKRVPRQHRVDYLAGRLYDGRIAELSFVQNGRGLLARTYRSVTWYEDLSLERAWTHMYPSSRYVAAAALAPDMPVIAVVSYERFTKDGRLEFLDVASDAILGTVGMVTFGLVAPARLLWHDGTLHILGCAERNNVCVRTSLVSIRPRFGG